MRLQTTHSLRNRLLWVLLVAIILTAAAQALISYRTARSEADARRQTRPRGSYTAHWFAHKRGNQRGRRCKCRREF